MGKLITRDVRKTFKIRASGRSTDFISPSFGYGCLYNCSYCYMKRHKDKGLSVAVNTGDILTEINNHAIRFSLMPQHKSDLHEPGTSKIIDRIKAIDAFVDAGYDVHVNYSPIIVYDGWLQDYEYIFDMMNDYVKYKDQVLAECIFLTHNFKKHVINLGRNPDTEIDLWVLDKQEIKKSQYGGENVRYKLGMKSEYIRQFREIHNLKVPWNTIRYIF
mgnify:CR=1 FL=1